MNNNFGFCGCCGQHFQNNLTKHIADCDGTRKYLPIRGVGNGIESGTIEDFVFQTGGLPTNDDINDYNL